jgi:L-fuconolactonase
MTMIDSHQHFWRLARGDYAWLTPNLAPLYRDFEPADLAPILQRHGIAGTVLVQAAASRAETDFMLALAGRCGFVRGVIGWVDFESPDAAAEIERLACNPLLKGLRPMIQDIADPAWMLRAALKPAFTAMQRCGLRLDALLKPRHLAPFARFMDLYGDLPMVIDHGAKPEIAAGRFPHWARQMRILARAERLHCKISGLVTEAGPNWRLADIEPYLDLLVDSFGPQRLMWGSDWPVIELAGGYDRWREASLAYLARLNQSGRTAILGGTAASFYGL